MRKEKNIIQMVTDHRESIVGLGGLLSRMEDLALEIMESQQALLKKRCTCGGELTNQVFNIKTSNLTEVQCDNCGRRYSPSGMTLLSPGEELAGTLEIGFTVSPTQRGNVQALITVNDKGHESKLLDRGMEMVPLGDEQPIDDRMFRFVAEAIARSGFTRRVGEMMAEQIHQERDKYAKREGNHGQRD